VQGLVGTVPAGAVPPTVLGVYPPALPSDLHKPWYGANRGAQVVVAALEPIVVRVHPGAPGGPGCAVVAGTIRARTCQLLASGDRPAHHAVDGLHVVAVVAEVAVVAALVPLAAGYSSTLPRVRTVMETWVRRDAPRAPSGVVHFVVRQPPHAPERRRPLVVPECQRPLGAPVRQRPLDPSRLGIQTRTASCFGFDFRTRACCL
jgi:hypothetical protein